MKHYKLDETTVEVEGNKQTIRTYHEPRNVVKDHASGFQQEYRYVVEGRDIDGMIEARKRALMTQVTHPRPRFVDLVTRPSRPGCWTPFIRGSAPGEARYLTQRNPMLLKAVS